MPTENIPTERLDNLAREAVVTVFDSMVGEDVTWKDASCLIENPAGDMLNKLPIADGLYAIVVSWVGDASGKVMLVLPKAAAERFALKLFDLPSLDWLEGEDSESALQDTLGELGNMMVGLVKGGLTKWYPNLALTTPKVLKNRRMKVDTAAMSFRRQYIFEGFGSELMIDFCCE
ncbi:chemotaxis protein CheX [Pelagicoccus sp. SDUM812002]|uniref:chemotaxis protein CheX n=1 Tax=Pelagicoccus sp. SDUM812002 TaxID=3041266 RepID=UPI00280D555C|nr:chemotaxis protein CheX [Pelagicoccus sp. SDUM812002]MDQ8186078.1 chemotaxis protein CheX [Pelagicoccus sp. SDUM812002]